MDQWAFFDEVKAGTVRNAYLFYGPEAYIRKSALTTLQKKLLTPGLEDMNCTFMQNPTAQQIVENCETLPMLGDWRLVIVQGLALLESGKTKDEAQESKTLVDYIGRVPPSTCLVFECEAPDKRKKLCQTLMKLPGAVSFDALSDARLTQWMNQTLRPMKKRMDANTCARLAFTSGRDLTMLNGELQKLAAYVGERETITAEDVEQIATHGMHRVRDGGRAGGRAGGARVFTAERAAGGRRAAHRRAGADYAAIPPDALRQGHAGEPNAAGADGQGAGRAALRPQPVDPAGGQAHDGAAEKAVGALRERGF